MVDFLLCQGFLLIPLIFGQVLKSVHLNLKICGQKIINNSTNNSPVVMCILLYRKNATSDDRMPNMLDSICCSWAAFKKIPPCCKQRRITFTAKLLLYSVSHCHTVYEKTLQQFKVVVVVTFVKLDVICSYRGRLDCPVCKAKNRIRLDKHLENVHCEIEVSVLYSLHFVVKLECILM